MHFEVLVEDQSGRIALESILEKILGPNYTEHSWQIRSYKGIGRLPNDLRRAPNPANRRLLHNLPSLLRAYGRRPQGSLAVIVVADSDNRDCIVFKQELLSVLNSCNPPPTTLFRIAIEEGEAWLLGDHAAIKLAYPNAKDAALNSYVQDSVCGTWEVLADAVHPGGSSPLKSVGYPVAGIAKCDWARKIAPHMEIDRNKSKSFQVFRDGVRKLAGA